MVDGILQLCTKINLSLWYFVCLFLVRFLITVIRKIIDTVCLLNEDKDTIEEEIHTHAGVGLQLFISCQILANFSLFYIDHENKSCHNNANATY